MTANILQPRRFFDREKRLFGRRVFCPCELCRLDYGRMLYPRKGGEPLGLGRLPGFAGNFVKRTR